jgi:hypothetical protein
MKHLLFFAVLTLTACEKEDTRPACLFNQTATLTVANISPGVLNLHVANDDICDVRSGQAVTLQVPAGLKQIGGYITMPNGDIVFDKENVDMEPCTVYMVTIDGE